MKHWQFYLAIIVYIILANIKVKEGNYSIPEQADIYDTPVFLVKKMQDIIDGKKTNDMVENENLKYQYDVAKKYNTDAVDRKTEDTETLATCKKSLDSLKIMNKNLSDQFTVCLGKFNEKSNLYNTCALNDLPLAIKRDLDAYNSLTNTNNLINQCNSTLQDEKNSVQRCHNDVSYWRNLKP
jgi:predicted RNase H-like nuclease (RuvC/YqgF family)